MHTFQPYPFELLEINPCEKIGKEWAVLTAGDKEKVNAMTISWGGMGVLWGKNVVFVFVRDSRYTKEFMDKEDSFSLTFFPKEFGKSALKYLGSISGKHEDKIKNARLHVGFAEGIPYIDEGNFIITCKKMSATFIDAKDFIDTSIKEDWYKDNDMHTMYVGEIREFLAR